MQTQSLEAREEGARVIRAVVQTGALETHYLRAGAGACLLLLAADGGMNGHLFQALARRFRVVGPEFPPRNDRGGTVETIAAPAAWSNWLRDLIDGLGLSRPALVVDEKTAMMALRFAATEPGRAGPVVVVRRDQVAPLQLAALQAEPGAARLLVLSVDAGAEASLAAEAAAEEIARFLGAESPGSVG